MLASLNCNRTAPSRSVRLAKFIAQNFYAADFSFLVSKDFNRIFKEAEYNAFFLRVCDFFNTRRHFIACTAVNYVYFFRTKTQCHTGSIHSNVSAANDTYFFCLVNRRCRVSSIVTFHKVCAGKIFVRTEYADKVFTRNVHKFRKTCARTYKGGVKALFRKQLVKRISPSYKEVTLKINAHFLKVINFFLNNRLWKTEFRNTVHHNAAGFMECLKHSNGMTGTRTVCRNCKTGRTCTDNGNFFSCLCSNLRHRDFLVFALPVCNKTFQASD